VSTSLFDHDPILRRIEAYALTFCAVAAVGAWVLRSGNPDVMLGVLGGGLLMGISYWAIRSSVTALAALAAGAGAAATDGASEPPAPTPKPGAILLRLAGRYALLGLIAYGMIARLRLHPVGLLIGVSSIFAAAVLETVRVAASAARRRPRA
jgi:hypothetical protein